MKTFSLSSFLVLSSIFYFLFSFAIEANAQSCQPVYGGGVVCPPGAALLLNKQVMHPQSGVFVENLGLNDPKFAPDSVVTFKLIVTNTGNATLSKVSIKDTLPQFVNFGTGPGTFDQKTKVLTIDAGGLSPNESKTFSFTTKVVPQDQLPASQGTSCVANQATATADSQTASDNAQVCIQKQVLGAPPVTKGGLKVFPPPSVTVTPPTGPEALSLLLLIPTGIAGFFLRRTSRRNINPKEERR